MDLVYFGHDHMTKKKPIRAEVDFAKFKLKELAIKIISFRKFG